MVVAIAAVGVSLAPGASLRAEPLYRQLLIESPTQLAALDRELVSAEAITAALADAAALSR